MPDEKNLQNLSMLIKNINQCTSELNLLLDNLFAEDSIQLMTEEEGQHIATIKEHNNLIIKELSTFFSDLSQKNNFDEEQEILKKTRHDLRNHINAILGYSELIIDTMQDYQSNLDSEKLGQILSQTRKMLAFIDKLQLAEPSSEAEAADKAEMQNSTHEVLENEGIEDENFPSFKKDFSILIVDDEEENRSLLEKNLLRSGYQSISSASNVVQAKSIIFSQRIDLVLLDINMPGTSGIEFLEELKDDIAKLKLMVVMVTGEDSIENAIKSIKLGAEDFLTKPINSAMLQVRVGACLKKKWFLMKETEYAHYLEIERKRYENLLSSIFPPIIVRELSETGKVEARSYNNVAMLFVDVVSFTTFCEINPVELTMDGIQHFSEVCEKAAIKYNLQKIKTIGDGFLAIAGMLTQHENTVLDCVKCAVNILEQTKKGPLGWVVRAGIDYGTIIGGVVGHRQFLFDVWGDAVNTAARVQAISPPDKVSLTDRAWLQIQDQCVGKSMDLIQLKGKDKPMQLMEFVSFKG